MFDSSTFVELSRFFQVTAYSYAALGLLTATLGSYWISEWQRGTPSQRTRTQAVWSFIQLSLFLVAVTSDSVVLSLVAMEFFFLSCLLFLKWSRSPRNSFVEQLGHLLAIACILWWTVQSPTASWNDAVARLSPLEPAAPSTRLALGLTVAVLALRSGLLPSRALGLKHTLQHMSTYAIPSMLFAWVFVQRVLLQGFELLAPYLLSLGLLVFIVFQWISQSRNQLSDVITSFKTAHVGWFWAFFGLAATSGQTGALFALFWPAHFVLFALVVFFAWLENEGVENTERTLRGMLNSQWVATFPGFIFLLGAWGQPWIGAAVLYPEALAHILTSGMGIAALFTAGLALQSTKAAHLALVMALPRGRRTREGMQLFPERGRLWLHWIMAFAAVAMGVWPFLVRLVL